MNRVFLVLRHSKDFDAFAVKRLCDQLPADTMVTLLADVPVIHTKISQQIALKYGWPGWWSKMELFRPDIPGDVFFMDLDTVVRGDITAHATIGKTTLLRDFYRADGLQSSLMYLTETDRGFVWREWSKDPTGHISRFSVRRAGRNGDQNFIEEVLGTGPRVARWQDVLPGSCVSYKVDYLRGRPCDGAVFWIFHGKPRPWSVGF